LGSDIDGSANLAPAFAPYGNKAIFGIVKKSKAFAAARLQHQSAITDK